VWEGGKGGNAAGLELECKRAELIVKVGIACTGSEQLDGKG
jgi:hypothetical protein